MAVDSLATEVSQTPLSQDGHSLQSGFLPSDGGLASAVGRLTRQPNQFGALNNLQQLTRGIWTSRGIGWTPQRAANFNNGNAFVEMGYYLDNLGNTTLIFQNGTKLYSYNLATSTETQVTGATMVATAIPTMRRFYSTISAQAVVIITAPNMAPLKMTSTTTAVPLTFTNNSGLQSSWNTSATFLGKTYQAPGLSETFGSRMVYGQFNAATTAFDILISNFQAPETFTQSATPAATDACSFTYPAELGALISLKAFRPSNQSLQEVLIGGCANGIFLITGTDTTSYALVTLTQEIGVLSNRAWLQIGNDLIFPSTNGFRSFSGVEANQVLIIDTISQGIIDLYNQIDFTQVNKIFVVHYPGAQEAQWWVPLVTDNGNCQHAFVCNYNNAGSGNGSIAPVWSTKSGIAIACGINFKNVFYGGGYGAGTGITTDGLLQVHYSGNTYNGNPIQFSLSTPTMSIGNPTQKQSARTFTFVMEGGAQSFYVNAYTYKRQSDGSMVRRLCQPAGKHLMTAAGPTTALGSWALGQGSFPASGLKTLDFKPNGNGVFWELEVYSLTTADALDYVGLAYTLSGGSLER